MAMPDRLVGQHSGTKMQSALMLDLEVVHAWYIAQTMEPIASFAI